MTTTNSFNEQHEMFDENIVRFIRTFASDVRRDVWCEMRVTPTDAEEWYVCATIDGDNVSRYRIPSDMTVGDALRMFPEFATI